MKNKYELVDESWIPTNTRSVRSILNEIEDIDDWKEFDFEIGGGWQFINEEWQGGHEGGGEEHWGIVSFSKDGGEKVYWYIPGFYQSHYGSEVEVENAYQVKPVEVKRVEWEKISKAK